MLKGIGGLVESKKRRASGTVVSVYNAEEADLDTEGGPFATVCEDHGSVCNHATLTLARRHAVVPEWCEDCVI